MIIDRYKSIIVDENKSGDITLLPKHNSDIMTEIIPDALEYVKNHCFKFKKGTYLSGLNGVDIEIFPEFNRLLERRILFRIWYLHRIIIHIFYK